MYYEWIINSSYIIVYIKAGLEMPKNTEWQKQISTKHAWRNSITAVISSGRRRKKKKLL